ncbi:MAG: TMEM165/GDT1 family protein [Myxococcota bacterium]|nr:TMEM165/GDT1 family protein [Myxococcota bacterium]
MDPRLFATVFVTVFVAGRGDKTQLATLLYAADAPNAKLTVYAAAAGALGVAAGLGGLAGGVLARLVSPELLRWVAGLGFVAVGLWVLLRPSG